MSYDLYFYKRKGRQISENEIGDYLTKNVTPVDENGNQWVFENEDTEVYFILDHNEPEDDPETNEMFENFSDFDNTHFTFNLNFLRPNFFGLEAFQFVEKFMTDLDLFVIDTQSVDQDNPRKIPASEMLATWSKTNLAFSADKFDEFGFKYIPIEQSDDTWFYNFHKQSIQVRLGDGYYVPKVFLMKSKVGNKAITLTTWTEHIPTVIPPADYFLLNKQYKKFFRTVTETGLISYETLMKNFGNYFEDFNFKGCKIIHPHNAAKVKDIFNGIKFEYKAGDFCERMEMEKLVNAKP
jgi:hypothetical protein